MNITIGSDHGAVALKDEVKMVLKEYEDIKVTDVGTFGTESVDYPDIAEKVCADVTSGKADLGIVLCGTGIGISIAANKVKGIRACCCSDSFSCEYTRRHNDQEGARAQQRQRPRDGRPRARLRPGRRDCPRVRRELVRGRPPCAPCQQDHGNRAAVSSQPSVIHTIGNAARAAE